MVGLHGVKSQVIKALAPIEVDVAYSPFSDGSTFGDTETTLGDIEPRIVEWSSDESDVKYVVGLVIAILLGLVFLLWLGFVFYRECLQKPPPQINVTKRQRNRGPRYA